MVTHKASVSFIGRTQKTAKTECGKTVKTSLIAIDSDCSCPDCREVIDASFNSMREMAEHAKASGLDTGAAEAALRAADPKRYQTIYFL